jgi:hypothetical protein
MVHLPGATPEPTEPEKEPRMPIPGPPLDPDPNPTVTVSLDDGTGTYPTDLTTRVNLRAGISVQGYGRTDEFGQPQSAGLSFTLKNDDGKFTTGDTPLSPGLGVRWSLTRGSTTADRFTGRITSVDVGWQGGPALVSDVVVSCQDILADLARRPMRSLLEEEILLLSPSAYYTLGEAEGSKTAGDTSGNQAPVLTQAGSGTAVKFGNGTGPVDGMTAATFAGGKFLSTQGGLSYGSSLPSLTGGIGACFATTTPGTSVVIGSVIAAANGWTLAVMDDGTLRAQGPGPSAFASSSATVTDGLTHAAFVASDGTTMTLVLDGEAVDTAPVANLNPAVEGFYVGGMFGEDSAGDTFEFTGTISHAAAFPSITAAEAEALGLFIADPTESTADRLTRIAGYADITPTTSTGSLSRQLMPMQATSGQSLFDALQTVAEAEDGVVLVNGTGDLVLQGRYYRGKKTTADLTLTAKLVDTGTSVTWDTQQKINQVTVTRNGGAAQVVSAAEVLADRNVPVYPTSLDLAVTDDADALYAAQWTLGKHTTTAPRLGSVTFDLMTASQADAEALLAMALGDRLALTLPSQAWANGDYTAEGWTETLTDTTWTLTVNLLPWEMFRVFILDDPVYGLLDGTNPLGH